MDTIKRLIPHLCIILAGMFITFVIVDKFNSFMAVLNNGSAKMLLLLFCIVAVVVSVLLIRAQRRAVR